MILTYSRLPPPIFAPPRAGGGRESAVTGILLTFMFLWNMVGALILMPALAHFLLPSTVAAEVGDGAAESGVAQAPLEASP